MPQIAVLKNKAKALGLTIAGSKTEIIDRIKNYLNNRTYSDIKTLIPPDEKCPKSKYELVELLINTDKPLTTIISKVDVNKTTIDQVTRTTKEQRKTIIPKKLRESVWDKYIGADVGIILCPCCNGTFIKQGGSNSWHCSHVIAEINGGTTTVNNLRVICAGCNSSIGTRSIYDFAISHYGQEAINRLMLSDYQYEQRQPIQLAQAIYPNAPAEEWVECGERKGDECGNGVSPLLRLKKKSLIVICRTLDISISKKNKAELAADIDVENFGGELAIHILGYNDLREIAKYEAIPGYGKMKKQDLLANILAFLGYAT